MSRYSTTDSNSISTPPTHQALARLRTGVQASPRAGPPPPARPADPLGPPAASASTSTSTPPRRSGPNEATFETPRRPASSGAAGLGPGGTPRTRKGAVRIIKSSRKPWYQRCVRALPCAALRVQTPDCFRRPQPGRRPARPLGQVRAVSLGNRQPRLGRPRRLCLSVRAPTPRLMMHARLTLHWGPPARIPHQSRHRHSDPAHPPARIARRDGRPHQQAEHVLVIVPVGKTRRHGRSAPGRVASLDAGHNAPLGGSWGPGHRVHLHRGAWSPLSLSSPMATARKPSDWLSVYSPSGTRALLDRCLGQHRECHVAVHAPEAVSPLFTQGGCRFHAQVAQGPQAECVVVCMAGPHQQPERKDS